MRLLTFALLLLGGCCDPGPGWMTGAPDMSAAMCPAGAEQVSTARCSYGVDATCRSPLGYDCRCLCTGYWECDQVHVVCDPDGGTPGE
ncbi:MAG TPA: hypothetical protein VN947_28750 [Polyangia bacterium]|nr:hypothetical protein [Polyangia bacterium]